MLKLYIIVIITRIPFSGTNFIRHLKLLTLLDFKLAVIYENNVEVML